MLTAAVFLALSILPAFASSSVASLSSVVDCATVIQVVSDGNGEEGSCEEQVDSSGSSFSCSSLQAGLDLSSEQQGDNCTELILTPGESFAILRAVVVHSSLVIRSADRQSRPRVAVTAERETQPPPDYLPFYVLTLADAQLAAIEGVDFVSSSLGIIAISNVAQAIVSNCSFSNFSEGALDIYDCPVVTVTDCTFKDNGPVGNTLKPDPFRSHSGGLSIGCHNLTLTGDPPTITVQNTLFKNNSALPSDELIQTTSQIFTGNLFTGRGGALGLKLSEFQASITATVENCTFIGNNASSHGGGTYILFGDLSAHVVTVRFCAFMGNEAGFGAGGLLGVFFGPGVKNASSFMNVSHCSFEENVAVQGGGSYITLPGTAAPDVATIFNYVRFEHCIFESNVATAYAAAIAISNPEIFRYRQQDAAFEIASCTFLNNKHKESTTLGSVFVPLHFEGYNIFDGGVGAAIQLAGSKMTLSGRLDITNNDLTGTNNGAMQFVSFSQLQMWRGSEIHFENNRGTIGASLTVETLDSYETLDRLHYNPLCFLLYEDLQEPPDQWTNVSISFDGNWALVGAVGYLTALDTCSWVQTHEPFFDNGRVLNWKFVKLGENTNTFHEQDPQDPMWYTQTNVYSISIKNTTVRTYPGENVRLQLDVLDELDQPVGSVIRLSPVASSNPDSLNITFEPTVELYGSLSQTFNTHLHVSSNATNEDRPLLLGEVIIDNYLQETNVEDSFQVYQGACPLGYVLSNLHEEDDTYECLCNSNNSNILFCNNGAVVFKERLWAAQDDSMEDQLFVYPCPSSYCQCKVSSIAGQDGCVYSYDSANPDQQCSCLRNGVLCGKCNNGSGHSALLNRCVTCGNSLAILVPLLVLVDAVLLVLIVAVVKCPFPDWLYPCLFFLQVQPFITESIPYGFEIVRRYLFFLVSGLSFYFPYDFCLFNEATTVVNYLLRFTPLLVDIVVIPTTLIFIWYFLKRRFTKPWYSVWLVVILQYTHIVHSAMSVLHCVKVPVNGTATDLRWFMDGEVECFAGDHLPLAILAMVVLALCAALIPLTVILLLREDTGRRRLFRRATESLQAGFRPGCRWWFPVELSRRFLLLLMAVPFPSSTYPLLFSVCILATVFSYVQPYKSKLANVIDSLLWVNAMAFFLVSIPEAFQTFEEYNVTDPISGCTGDQVPVYIFSKAIYAMFISYYVPLLVTMVTVLGFIAAAILRKWCPRGASRRSRGSIRDEREPSYNRITLPAPTVTYELDDMYCVDNASIDDLVNHRTTRHRSLLDSFIANLKRTKSSDSRDYRVVH